MGATEATMAARSWKSFFRPKRAHLRHAYFEDEPSGRLLYLPHGRNGLFPLARHTYVVPSAEAADRIVEAHGRWSFVMTVGFAATIAALIAVVAYSGDAVFR